MSESHYKFEILAVCDSELLSVEHMKKRSNTLPLPSIILAQERVTSLDKFEHFLHNFNAVTPSKTIKMIAFEIRNPHLRSLDFLHSHETKKVQHQSAPNWRALA